MSTCDIRMYVIASLTAYLFTEAAAAFSEGKEEQRDEKYWLWLESWMVSLSFHCTLLPGSLVSCLSTLE